MLEKFEDNPSEAMKPQIARLINSILSDNSLRAPMFGETNYLTLENIAAAAKTGTTQEYRDGWTVGYSPHIAVGVWVGNNDNSKMMPSADGVRVAAPIWHDFMKKAYEIRGWSSQPFSPPDPIASLEPVLSGVLAGALTIGIDKISGKRATEFTPLELIEEKVFSDPHTLLPPQDPQFPLWEEGIQKWANEFLPISLPQEYDDVHTAQTTPRISILTPSPHDTLEREKSAELTFRVENVFPVERVEVFFDGQISTTIPSANIRNTDYTLHLKIPSLQKNALTIKVRVFDAVLNRAEAEVTVTLR